MFSEILASNLDPNSTSDKTIEVQIQLPNKCPHCSTAYSSRPSSVCFFKDAYGGANLYATFFCPACEKAFFVTYGIEDFFSREFAHIINQFPVPDVVTSIPEKIHKLSPKFVEIFHQAETAENSGLSELCGIGYRKALEFLIKDYVISIHPESKDDIESSFLGKCIDTYIDNPKIKALAKASSWIGNDETHYVRRNSDYNVKDLKRFISAAVTFIVYELTVSEAQAFLDNSQ